MYDEQFTALGIDSVEARVYISMLSCGAVTAGNLAKRTGIPRPSMYTILKRLIEKGFVIESQKNHLKVFTPIHPDKVEELFTEKKSEIESSQEMFKKSLPDLRALLSDSYMSPKLELFESKEGLERVLKDMLLYRDIKTEAIWPIQTMVDVLSPEFFKRHNIERIKNNIYTRAIWPENQIINFKQHPYLGSGTDFKREIRIAPENIDFSMGYWIYGKKIAFLSSRNESFGFILESAELAKTLRSQFEIIWAKSDPVVMKSEDVKDFIQKLS